MTLQPIRRADTPRRNAPCPCGSGKKAKRCCLPNIHRLAALPVAVRTQAIVSQILGHSVFDAPGQIRRGFGTTDASPGTPQR